MANKVDANNVFEALASYHDTLESGEKTKNRDSVFETLSTYGKLVASENRGLARGTSNIFDALISYQTQLGLEEKKEMGLGVFRGSSNRSIRRARRASSKLEDQNLHRVEKKPTHGFCKCSKKPREFTENTRYSIDLRLGERGKTFFIKKVPFVDKGRLFPERAEPFLPIKEGRQLCRVIVKEVKSRLDNSNYCERYLSIPEKEKPKAIQELKLIKRAIESFDQYITRIVKNSRFSSLEKQIRAIAEDINLLETDTKTVLEEKKEFNNNLMKVVAELLLKYYPSACAEVFAKCQTRPIVFSEKIETLAQSLVRAGFTYEDSELLNSKIKSFYDRETDIHRDREFCEFDKPPYLVDANFYSVLVNPNQFIGEVVDNYSALKPMKLEEKMQLQEGGLDKVDLCKDLIEDLKAITQEVYSELERKGSLSSTEKLDLSSSQKSLEPSELYFGEGRPEFLEVFSRYLS